MSKMKEEEQFKTVWIKTEGISSTEEYLFLVDLKISFSSSGKIGLKQVKHFVEKEESEVARQVEPEFGEYWTDSSL